MTPPDFAPKFCSGCGEPAQVGRIFPVPEPEKRTRFVFQFECIELEFAEFQHGVKAALIHQSCSFGAAGSTSCSRPDLQQVDLQQASVCLCDSVYTKIKQQLVSI